ncbi:MAG: hypothetical protein P4L85_12355 [Paludisphaera borealis]|uniref:hypothetical protein n=1 Tax=Paludisphaera borealis TaxID=1387353 RepID=UPI0028483213|nr:hypothetical protein [Paludisphaera borealis]MDR3620136.1 hypothetical protein [Paludisphaera borealis]
MARVPAYLGGVLLTAAILQTVATESCKASEPRPWIAIRGVYGGVPSQVFDRKQTLDDYGVNAVWIGSGGVTREVVERLKQQSPGLRVFAEFNTMHEAGYLDEHPDAAPVGADGKRCPAPDGWQGVCPTHPGYRRERMEAFRRTLAAAPIDGIWLDYHHAHASWEQAEPNLPDTCFCPRCLALFSKETGVVMPDSPTPELARRLLGPERASWVKWRCDVFTAWVRDFRAILDATRPQALLGTFHCPWSDDERDDALRAKLAIDLIGQAKYLDVFSIMTYHARFGHADDPAWISRQTAWLGRHLGIRGVAGERLKIWPIVQLSDWDEPRVPTSQVAAVLDHGARKPATGVTVFVWSTLHPQWPKVEEMGRFYKAIKP